MPTSELSQVQGARYVGRYRLHERIGEGAMAFVYRAFDPEIGRDLAIKLLKPEFRRNGDYAARFLREARAAGALAHPNIVTIFDVGEAEGHPYIAMELLDGEPLDVVMLRGKAFPLEAAMAVGVQLAQALQYAHAQGVVHRDIKPSNIFLGRDGRTAKILDFGIASQGDPDQTLAEAELLKTQGGQVLGTPRYMSPEQALGETLDGRSDLFSVGVVLYELISGHKAFDGATAVTLALQITQQDPPSLAVRAPGAPAGLITIIAKLLAKKPGRRFADGGALAAALGREHQQYVAALAEAASRRGLPLQARVTLMMTAIVAIVLAISIGTVLRKQYVAMEQMAISSGSAIVSFVASNVALSAAENDGLPPDQRDWLPVQAFAKVAAADPNVRQITIIDSHGVVQGASDPAMLGRPYRAHTDETVMRRAGEAVVSATREADGDNGFRFYRPILYSGRRVGAVDVSMREGDLAAVAELSKALMAGLTIVTLGAVLVVGSLAARLLTQPVRRLKTALDAAVAGDLDLRILHSRKDEFGQAFDSFNQLMGVLAHRLDGAEPMRPASPAVTPSAKVTQALASVDRVLRKPDPMAETRVLEPAPAPALASSEGASRLWKRLQGKSPA